ncbi:CLUMA_CG007009, isoform A [Clunio marinus]|uniref:CLUMA_CG007009, isoform A n=1 Tax=Clunio marinus TaxID=568069 RepID=A0A1J1I517_9DIPT|nr:CLUMA_CG007009, isoform A [Clunio marinus]
MKIKVKCSLVKVENPIPLVARNSPQLEKSESSYQLQMILMLIPMLIVEEEIVPGIIVEGYVEDL